MHLQSMLTVPTLAYLAAYLQVSLAAPGPNPPAAAAHGGARMAASQPAANGRSGWASNSAGWSSTPTARVNGVTGWSSAPTDWASATGSRFGGAGGWSAGPGGRYGWSGSSKPTSTICYTSMGVTDLKKSCGTSWFTHSTAYKASATSTVTTTTTPDAVTTTVVVFVTSTVTGPASYNTQTSTIITTQVTTTTAPAFNTIISSYKHISTALSSVVPAPAGFMPVQTTLPQTNNTAMRKRTFGLSGSSGSSGWSASSGTSGTSGMGGIAGMSGAANTVSSLIGGTRARIQGLSFNSRNFSRIAFPQNIRCHVYHGQCTTTTTTLTVTSTAAASTATVKSTSTIVVTTIPNAQTTTTTTSTVTSAVTVTPTISSTTTLTDIVYTSTAISYAACATNNIVNNLGGQGILGVAATSNSNEGFDYTSSTNAYDCCVDAMQNPLGSAFVFSTVDNSCSIFEASTCPAGTQASLHQATFANTGTLGGGYVIGNAACGQYDTSAWSS